MSNDLQKIVAYLNVVSACMDATRPAARQWGEWTNACCALPHFSLGSAGCATNRRLYGVNYSLVLCFVPRHLTTCALRPEARSLALVRGLYPLGGFASLSGAQWEGTGRRAFSSCAW